jgi:hypothetical protein
MSNATKPWSSVRAAALAGLIGATLFGGLTSTAWALTAEQLAQAQANFKAANPSGGPLDPTKFKAFIDLNATTMIGRSAAIKSNNAYDRAFGVVDANKDGFVTWDEFVKAQ